MNPWSIIKHMKPVTNIALGIGVTVIGSYVGSRIQNKQESEARLDRLEQVVEKLVKLEEEKK